MTTQSKLSKALEIHQAMAFLNIPQSQLHSLLQEYGGIDGLHQEMEERLCGEEPTQKLNQEDLRLADIRIKANYPDGNVPFGNPAWEKGSIRRRQAKSRKQRIRT